MLQEFTLAILKPDAIRQNYIIPILNKIYKVHFKIVAIKMHLFSIKEAKNFYKIHKLKPFFESLVIFMSSGPIISLVLEKKNAIIDFRNLIGATNPKNAYKNTIRNIYAKSIEENVIHGSDNKINAIKEINFIFSQNEIFSKDIKIFLNSNY